MNTPHFLTGLALLAASCAPAFADFDDYKPSTLKEVFAIDGNGCAELTGKNVIIDPLRQVFTAHAAWRGEVRPIEPMTRQIISWYGKTLQQPTWGDLFKAEAHVSDDGVDYWIPIQESLVGAFKNEVGVGGTVELCVAFFGCYAKHPVVGINEFHAAPH